MIVRAAQESDAPAMARVMVDTYMSAHKGQIPEGAWLKRRAEWTYAVSERDESDQGGMQDDHNPKLSRKRCRKCRQTHCRHVQ